MAVIFFLVYEMRCCEIYIGILKAMRGFIDESGSGVVTKFIFLRGGWKVWLHSRPVMSLGYVTL